MKVVRHALFTLCVFVVTTTAAWAQATAQMGGTVRDETGGVLPGVDVTATQTDTGVMRTSITNETGSYVLANLPLGPYRLEVNLAGFRTFAQTGIVLRVNDSPVINVVLQLGQIGETVEVQAGAPLVEVRNQGISAVVGNERIEQLPLNGRNVTDLIILAGAATPSTGGGELVRRIPSMCSTWAKRRSRLPGAWGSA